MVSNWFSKPGDKEDGVTHAAVVTVLMENGRLSLEQVILHSQTHKMNCMHMDVVNGTPVLLCAWQIAAHSPDI